MITTIPRRREHRIQHAVAVHVLQDVEAREHRAGAGEGARSNSKILDISDNYKWIFTQFLGIGLLSRVWGICKIFCGVYRLVREGGEEPVRVQVPPQGLNFSSSQTIPLFINVTLIIVSAMNIHGNCFICIAVLPFTV